MGGRALETFRPVLRMKTLKHILRENMTGCGRNYISGLCSGLAIARDDVATSDGGGIDRC